MKESTLNDFYFFCDSEHRELYSVLLHDWEEMGLAWCCESGVLFLGINSAIKDVMSVCFTLHTGGVEPASIRVDMKQWRNELGQEEMVDFIANMRRIQGISCQQRRDTLFIENPAHILAPVQKELRNIMHQFGLKVVNKIVS